MIDFEEKPKTQEKLNRVRTDTAWLEKLGLKARGRPYLASMGIYLFNARALVELLESSDATDFGHEILPQTIANHRVQAHLFDGYWEDIGTVGAFHQANIDLTARSPVVRFHVRGAADLHPASLPAVLTAGRRHGEEQSDLRRLHHRPRSGDRELRHRRPFDHRREATIRDSYLMGIDLLRAASQIAENQRQGRPAPASAPVGDRAGHHRQECSHRP